MRVFVFVHTQAFGVFDEAHAQFALSDALYAALELLHTESAADASAPVPTANDADAGLEALFSDFLGAGADDGQDEDASGAKTRRPADQLAPLLKDITLRDHQRAAVHWMLARENQLLAKAKTLKAEATAASQSNDRSADDTMNPVRTLSLSTLVRLSVLTRARAVAADVGDASVRAQRRGVLRESVREDRVAAPARAADAVSRRHPR